MEPQQELTSSIEVNSRITNCDGNKACGDQNFMAAICTRPGGRGSGGATIETPFVSWNHFLRQGYWCMPCCILKENKHSKMKVCSELPSVKDLRNQNQKHGRCGIEFNPEFPAENSKLEDENSKLNCREQRDLESRVSNPHF